MTSKTKLDEDYEPCRVVEIDISIPEKGMTVERVQTARLCEKCGTTRRIVETRNSARAYAGNERVSSSGRARCECPDTMLNDLDRRAIEEARGES